MPFSYVRFCNLPEVGFILPSILLVRPPVRILIELDQAPWSHSHSLQSPPSSLAHHCHFYSTIMRFQLFELVVLSLFVSLSTATVTGPPTPNVPTPLRHKQNWSTLTNRTVLNLENPSELEKRDGTKYVFMHHVSGRLFRRQFLSLNPIDELQIVGSKTPLLCSTLYMLNISSLLDRYVRSLFTLSIYAIANTPKLDTRTNMQIGSTMSSRSRLKERKLFLFFCHSSPLSPTNFSSVTRLH